MSILKSIRQAGAASYHNVVIVLALLLIVSSCTIQKRYAMPGYYIEWYNGGNSIKKNWSKTELPPSLTKLKTYNSTFVQSDNNDLGLSASTVSLPELKPRPQTLHEIRTSSSSSKTLISCDTLVDKQNQKIAVHITEITPIEIKYKRCDNPDGPTNIVYKSNYKLIHYANGTTDTLSTDNTTVVNGGVQHRELNIMAALSFAFGAGGITFIYLAPIGAVLGIIFGIIGLIQIRNNPKKYKGVGYAYAGMGCGTLILLLTAIIIAASIGFFDQ